MLKKQKISTEYDKSTMTYLKEIGKIPSLSQQEEYDLWHKYKFKHDLAAKEKLINSNLKFVANVAKGFQGRGLSYADLIAEGNIGLIKSIDKFDGDKGYKLISYSVWWIKQTIKEALRVRNCTDTDDLPENNADSNNDFDDIEYVNPAELNSYIYDDYNNNSDAKEKVGYLMNFLNDREKFIVRNYWGLEGCDPMTLDDIGKELGLTKERVRQISEKCKLKLRSEGFDIFKTSDIY